MILELFPRCHKNPAQAQALEAAMPWWLTTSGANPIMRAIRQDAVEVAPK